MNNLSRPKDITGLEVLLIILTSVGWLLPNHYKPWNTFHTNAWIAFFIFIAAFIRIYQTRQKINISYPSAGLLFLSTIPWIQYFSGTLPLFSSALMCWIFLIGLALTFVLGENWNREDPGKPIEYVLTSACIAAVISVALQIIQWLGLTQNYDLMDIWIMQIGDGGRPFANIGQPNMLASLLLWGLLGCFLAYLRGRINRTSAMVISTFILFGVALTESRTALLTLTLGVILLLINRSKTPVRQFSNSLLILYALYLFFLFGQEYLARLMGLDEPLTLFTRSAGEIRAQLWAMSIDASTVFPWFGAGWGRTNAAFFEVWEKHPTFSNLYSEQAHNLILDIIIWVGWPIGIVITAAACWWAYRSYKGIRSDTDYICFAALGVLIIHAMLELPLHHAYFLLPFGILAGAASFSKNNLNGFTASKTTSAALLIAIFFSFLIIARDYINVEKSFTELRFQMARIGVDHDTSLPNTILLTDWPRVIAFNRSTPAPGMSHAEIEDWKAMMIYNASPLSIRKLIGALMLNGREVEGRQWARRACFLLAARACDSLADEWVPPISEHSK